MLYYQIIGSCLTVHILSDGCTWAVWRALEKLELVSAAPQATLNSLRFFSVLLASYFLHPKLDIRSLSMGILFNSL